MPAVDMERPATPFIPVVVGREVRHTTFPTPNGDVEGYQLRFQLASLRPDGSELTTWTDWLHLPNPLMLHLTESLDEFMRTEGHLRPLRCAPSRSR